LGIHLEPGMRGVVAGGRMKVFPAGAEGSGWQNIAWQPGVAAAVKESKATGKPIFLFTFVSPGGRHSAAVHPQANKDDC
jgi:hypothetical protein